MSGPIFDASRARRTARSASGIPASATCPTTSSGTLGLIDAMVLSVHTFSPLITSGYFLPKPRAHSRRAPRAFFPGFPDSTKFTSGAFSYVSPGGQSFDRMRRFARLTSLRESPCLESSDSSCRPNFASGESFGSRNNSSAETLSENFARRKPSLDVFSSNRRTRYDMPGRSSPTGQYSRTR